MADLLLSEVTDSVLILTMNRPESRNALSSALVRRLLNALADADTDPMVKAVVLTGASTAFCAGGDLSDIPEDSDAAALAVRHRDFVKLARSITTSHKPIVAAVNGPAVGAGVSLALASDYVVIADAATLRLSFLSVGLPPDLLSVSLLRARTGTTVAADLLYSGSAISAEKAVRRNLADEHTSQEALLSTALDAARRLGELPAFAFSATKTLLRHAGTLGDALADIEPFAVGASAASNDFINATARYRR